MSLLAPPAIVGAMASGRQSRLQRMADAALTSAPVVLPLMLWELAAWMGWINTFLFPPPLRIAATIWTQSGPGGNPPWGIPLHVGRSLFRLLTGMALAVVFGTLIGVAIGMTRWGRFVFRPLISALMPVPTLAWTPVLLLAVGIDDRATIIVVFIAASFEIIYTIVAGIEQMSVRVFWVAQSMGATPLQIFWRVIIPGILPYLITGVRLGTGYAWRALIAAEMLAASSYGLGFMIFDASEYMSMDVIYGGVALIALLGYPATLSGGMKQRVAIARALAYEPEILLLDEPFGALDIQTKNYMIRDLQNLWQEANRTIVMITHSVSEAVFMADRVLVLSSRPSRIVADVRIELPHPRDTRDPDLKRYDDEVTAILSTEVDKAMALERGQPR